MSNSWTCLMNFVQIGLLGQDVTMWEEVVRGRTQWSKERYGYKPLVREVYQFQGDFKRLWVWIVGEIGYCLLGNMLLLDKFFALKNTDNSRNQLLKCLELMEHMEPVQCWKHYFKTRLLYLNGCDTLATFARHVRAIWKRESSNHSF